MTIEWPVSCEIRDVPQRPRMDARPLHEVTHRLLLDSAWYRTTIFENQTGCTRRIYSPDPWDYVWTTGGLIEWMAMFVSPLNFLFLLQLVFLPVIKDGLEKLRPHAHVESQSSLIRGKYLEKPENR
ncbi:hypothetical protein SODALDRAFT_18086 [Sodiomyces alkalinus F11]|uniref:Uncharacterized protein n=1 Tax=Sodiomyces alkalinus (strain CBS 110278 / VKM F-3762 / F11) TaxID=1314773 RepID=A0A3N2Q752_SODAK|nr:hypothetical protein SODALDRAFT_18086 [Sodiomyces alkalinus F11]ROT42546.1 hypothetical protein SODALDRAFT_18086 [Sodiomyces alkalinus F11]